MTTPEQRLRDYLGEVSDLEHAAAVLGWDEMTGMPPEGGASRASALATLTGIIHERMVSDDLARLLDAAGSSPEAADPESDLACIVRVTRRDYDRARRVPGELAMEISRAQSEGYAAWTGARQASDFAAFLPYLERNIELRRRYIDCFEPAASPWDVLAEDFEHGLTSAEITPVFDALKRDLIPLVDLVRANADRVDDAVLHRTYPVADQEAFLRDLLPDLGYSPDSWRFDRTVHPFANGVARGDVRITTRYDANFVPMALFGTIHEFGHGLYEAQVSPSLDRTPLYSGCSMITHESQSRLWENLVGRGRPFWNGKYPALQAAFPDALRNVDVDQFWRAINKLHPSLIRVEADELTYGFHIILRYELERDIFEGRLAAADLPEAWNARMRDYLGIEVPNDAQGVLQDVHWAGAMFGYFPTYLLGTILSVQVWERAKAALGDLDGQVERGEFAPLREWLRVNLHDSGRKFDPKETIRRAVGGDLDPAPYVSYLTGKVNALYGDQRKG